MKNFKTFLSVSLLMFTVVLFAQDGGDGIEPTTPSTIVGWLTPFIVLGATWLIRLAKPLIPAWATMMVVAGLSAAVAWVTALTVGGDMSFVMQVALGLLSVFINQAYRAFTAGGNAAFARKK